jgi:hypothetical protein
LPNASQLFIQNTVFDRFEFAGFADQTWKNASRWNDKLPRKKLAASFIVASNVAEMNPRYVALRNLLT